MTALSRALCRSDFSTARPCIERHAPPAWGVLAPWRALFQMCCSNRLVNTILGGRRSGGATLQDIMSRFHGTWAVKPESDDPASPRCSAVLEQEVLPKGDEGSLLPLGPSLPQHQPAACK